MKQVDFIKSLYEMTDDEIKSLYKVLKKNKDELSQRLANILLDYTIADGNMDIKRVDRVKLYNDISKEVIDDSKEVSKIEVDLIDGILITVINETAKYWNYNIGFEDVRKIIKNNFKGKHFSTRVWDNESDVAKELHLLINDFLDGKINVNQIKNRINKTFNKGAYNAKRLVETEVARVEDEAFKRFCNETGVKKIKRNAILDTHTCSDCADYDGVIYDLDKAPTLPSHPNCRCFYEIVE
ncbi:minor capsid protein [Clostridium sp. NSJ-49]|uniref:minor capsid protein n=1 Tax=Clostridium TaxID=1485 RepID=UPI00164A61BC|nr:minor capsid protein [Clostridium sp. NSJ-49]MBC5626761.1 minor capsid protein [Clostridium sp. NSJ-49]